MRSPEAAKVVLDSKWGSSSVVAGLCTMATGGASDLDDEDGADGSDVDVLLVPDPVVGGETVADAETTPVPGNEDEVVDTSAAAIGDGRTTGEGARWIRLGIRCSTDAASARAARRCC